MSELAEIRKRHEDLSHTPCGQWETKDIALADKDRGTLLNRIIELEAERDTARNDYGTTAHQLDIAEARLEAETNRICQWDSSDPDWGIWSGTCGIEWTFLEDGPEENGCKHCPQCGGKLIMAALKAGEGA